MKIEDIGSGGRGVKALTPSLVFSPLFFSLLFLCCPLKFSLDCRDDAKQGK